MFDTPVFKILAANDTGQAPGHQGGFVIPGEIEEFFPDIAGELSPTNPTAETQVFADLIVGGKLIGSVQSRYQYQSWGGTRFERRLTSGLGPLRNVAFPGDIVLFSRDLSQLNHLVLTLVEAGTPEHTSILAAANGQRWGFLPGQPEPVRNTDIQSAVGNIRQLEEGEFKLTADSRSIVEGTVRRKVRKAAFRKVLFREYGEVCIASGECISGGSAGSNLDAAHIMPVELGGTDDPRNGLILSKDLHWAFDKGLFGIGDNYEIIVPAKWLENGRNPPLSRIYNRRLAFGSSKIRPHADALAWHRTARLGMKS
jgi:putative restriction endonuclease